MCVVNISFGYFNTQFNAVLQYGDAAILSLVLESLPQIAAEVSAPLAKTDEIVLIGTVHPLPITCPELGCAGGSDRTTQEVNRLVGTLPPAISALTGVDLTGVSDQHRPLPHPHHKLEISKLY